MSKQSKTNLTGWHSNTDLGCDLKTILRSDRRMKQGKDYVASKRAQRAQSTLLRKVAHGRISATRDGAYQLTLKVFKREGLDVRETLTREAFELLNNVKF